MFIEAVVALLRPPPYAHLLKGMSDFVPPKDRAWMASMAQVYIDEALKYQAAAAASASAAATATTATVTTAVTSTSGQQQQSSKSMPPPQASKPAVVSGPGGSLRPLATAGLGQTPARPPLQNHPQNLLQKQGQQQVAAAAGAGAQRSGAYVGAYGAAPAALAAGGQQQKRPVGAGAGLGPVGGAAAAGGAGVKAAPSLSQQLAQGAASGLGAAGAGPDFKRQKTQPPASAPSSGVGAGLGSSSAPTGAAAMPRPLMPGGVPAGSRPPPSVAPPAVVAAPGGGSGGGKQPPCTFCAAAPIVNAHEAPCGHVACYQCWLSQIGQQGKCKVCSKPVKSRQLMRKYFVGK